MALNELQKKHLAEEKKKVESAYDSAKDKSFNSKEYAKSASWQQTMAAAESNTPTVENTRNYKYEPIKLSSTPDTGTARGMLAAIYNRYDADKDEQGLGERMNLFNRAMQEPDSPIYKPYGYSVTNQRYIDALADLGVDVSGGINDEWFEKNAYLTNFYNYSSTGDTPTSPGKNASKQEQAAYWYYQLLRDEETTKSAETEWKQMQDNIGYLVGLGYSDDEIYKKIQNDMTAGEYSTLSKMDEYATNGMGAPLGMNRSVQYDEDGIYGSIWAARNPDKSTGDSLYNAAQYALGVGNKWHYDPEAVSTRDPSSANYNPYLLPTYRLPEGIDLSDESYKANLVIDPDTGKPINPKDGTQAQIDAYKRDTLQSYVDQTDDAKEELSALREQAQKWLDSGKSVEWIMDKLQDPATSGGEKSLFESEYPTLNKMESYRSRGGYLPLTEAVDYTPASFEAWLREQDGAIKAQKAVEAGKPTAKEQELREGAAEVAAFRAQEQKDAAANATFRAFNADKQEEVPALLRNWGVDESGNSLPVRDKIDAIGKELAIISSAAPGSETEKVYASALEDAQLQRNAEIALADELAEYQKGNVQNPSPELSAWLDKYGVLVGGQTLREVANTGMLRDSDVGNIYYQEDQRKELGEKATNALDAMNSGMFSDAERTEYLLDMSRHIAAAEQLGMTLEEYYDSDNGARADTQVRGIVKLAEIRQEERAQKEYQLRRELFDSVNAAQKGETLFFGENMTAEDAAAVKSYIDTLDISSYKKSDALYLDYQRQIEDVATLYRDNNFDESGFGNESWLSAGAEAYAMQRLNADARKAAFLGVSLDEYYRAYGKTTPEQMFADGEKAYITAAKEMGVETVALSERWKVYETALDQVNESAPKQTETAQSDGSGVGFFKAVGMGAESGWRQYWIDKANALSFYVTDVDANTAEADLRSVFPDPYVARQVITSSIENIEDPTRKAYWEEQLAGAQDIYKMGYTPSDEEVRNFMYQQQKHIDENADIIMQHGTPLEQSAYGNAATTTHALLGTAEYSLKTAAFKGLGIAGRAGSLLGAVSTYAAPEGARFGRAAMQSGMSRDEARNWSLLVGFTNAASEVYTDEILDGIFSNSVVSRAITSKFLSDATTRGFAGRFVRMTGDYVMRRASDVVKEGFQETAQETINQVMYSTIIDGELRLDLKGLKDSFEGSIAPVLIMGVVGGFPSHMSAYRTANAIMQSGVTQERIDQLISELDEIQNNPQSRAEVAKNVREIAVSQKVVDAVASGALAEIQTSPLTSALSAAKETNRQAQAAEVEARTVLEDANANRAALIDEFTASVENSANADLMRQVSEATKAANDARAKHQEAMKKSEEAAKGEETAQKDYDSLVEETMMSARARAAEIVDGEIQRLWDSVRDQSISREQQNHYNSVVDEYIAQNMPDASEKLKNTVRGVFNDLTGRTYNGHFEAAKPVETGDVNLPSQTTGAFSGVTEDGANAAEATAAHSENNFAMNEDIAAQEATLSPADLEGIHAFAKEKGLTIHRERGGSSTSQFAAKAGENTRLTEGEAETLSSPEMAAQTSRSQADVLAIGRAYVQSKPLNAIRNEILRFSEQSLTEFQVAELIAYAERYHRENKSDMDSGVLESFGLGAGNTGAGLAMLRVFYEKTGEGAVMASEKKIEKARKDMSERRQTKVEQEESAEAAKDVAATASFSAGLISQGETQSVTIGTGKNRQTLPLTQVQQYFIKKYGLNSVNRPGDHYNRATIRQRMLETILIGGNDVDTVSRQLYDLKHNIPVSTAADAAYIQKQMNLYSDLGADAGGRDAQVAFARAHEAEANQFPVSMKRKLSSYRKTAMLLNFKTPDRNVLSNVVYAPVEAAKNAISIPVDAMYSLFTQNRTTAALDVKDRIRGVAAFRDGLKNAYLNYKDKVTLNQDGKYSTTRSPRTFQSGALNAIESLNAFIMSFGDQGFWQKAYENSIARQKKLLGTELVTEEMLKQAAEDADYTCYQEDNKLIDAIEKIKAESPVVGVLLDVVVPFTKIPTNLVKRGYEYSPVGLAVSMGRLLLDATYRGDQRKAVQDLSKGLTGTALTMAGYFAAATGLVKWGYGDEEDYAYGQVRRADGAHYGLYLDLGETTIDISWAAPVIMPFSVGVNLYKNIEYDQESMAKSFFNMATRSLEDLLNMSFMDSLAEFMDEEKDFSEKAISIGGSYVGQNIPAVLRHLAAFLDPYERDTADEDSFMAQLNYSLISAIPGLRNTLPARVDITGDPVKQDWWTALLVPFAIKHKSNDEAVQEIIRLYTEMTPAERSASSVPSLPVSQKRPTIANGARALTNEEVQAFNSQAAQLAFDGGSGEDKTGDTISLPGINTLIESDAYKAADRSTKMEMISNQMGLGVTIAKENFLKNVTGRAEKAENGYNPSTYVSIPTYFQERLDSGDENMKRIYSFFERTGDGNALPKSLYMEFDRTSYGEKVHYTVPEEAREEYRQVYMDYIDDNLDSVDPDVSDEELTEQLESLYIKGINAAKNWFVREYGE